MDRERGLPLLCRSMPQQVAVIQRVALGVSRSYKIRTGLPVGQVRPEPLKQGFLLLPAS